MPGDEPWGYDGPPSDITTIAPCAVVLGLDCSSTTIGWVLWDGAARDHGTLMLPGAIAERCRRAYAGIGLILETHPDIDCIAIESPIARYASAVIPQARVSGAVLVRAALAELHVIEVTPTQAKRALTGTGNASKQLMQTHAAAYGVTGEHASDSLGVAQHAAEQVEVMG